MRLHELILTQIFVKPGKGSYAIAKEEVAHNGLTSYARVENKEWNWARYYWRLIMLAGCGWTLSA